jgi:hypothetical protein
MAVNYSIPELLEVLRGNDMDLVSDAFRRFPIISKLLVESDAVDSKLTDKFVAMVPDYVNARKANKSLVEHANASDDSKEFSENMHVSGDDDGDDDEEQAVKPVEEIRSEKKSEPEQEDDEETEEVDYYSMKAMDLYKLCQKRGIEAEPKHRTKYYITLLEKADQEAETPVESFDDDDDDDWDI